MIEIHVELLQNLQQALIIVQIPSSADCHIRSNQLVIEDNGQTQVDFNGLLIDVEKGTEVPSPSNVTRDGHVCRAFKFPFVQLPPINVKKLHDLQEIRCRQCQTKLKIFADSGESFQIINQPMDNADEINEVMFCHRYCDAHEHQHEQKYQPSKPLDLHTEKIIVESIDSLIVAREHILSVQCPQCQVEFGSIGPSSSRSDLSEPNTNLVSLEKSSLLPYASDYLTSCFHQCEPGRYIVKVAKSNEGLILIWILPNEILSSSSPVKLEFFRQRKILFARLNSVDHPLINDWRRDFSVTTLLVNRRCLDELSKKFSADLQRFPHRSNDEETFQTLTIFF